MAVRSRVEFTSRAGVEWRVDIHDQNFTGTRLDFAAAGSQNGGIQINYDRSDSLHNWGQFMFSKADIYIAITTQDEEDEIDYLIENQSEDFQVEIYKDSAIYWRGVLTQDLIEKPNQSRNYVVKIPATDGLKRLEQVEEEIPSAATTNSLIRLIVEILKRIGTIDLYGALDTLLATSNRWYETQMASVGVAVDPLDLTRAPFVDKLYQSEDNLGDITYTNYLQVLDDLLKTFGCFIVMAKGIYHVIQYDQLFQNTIYLHYYNKNSFGSKGNAFDPDVIPDNIEAGSTFTYSPEIKRAIGRQDVEKFAVLRGYNSFVEFTSTARAMGSISQSASRYVILDLPGSPFVICQVTSSTPNNLTADLDIKLTLGGAYRLTNKNGFPQWSTTLTDTWSQRGVPMQKSGTGGASASFLRWPRSTSIYLPPPPISGAVTLQMEGTVRTLGGVTPVTGVSNIVVYSNANLRLFNKLPDDLDAATEINYEAGDSAASSSFILDRGEFTFGDRFYQGMLNTLEVYDGSSWEASALWQRQGSGSTYNIIRLNLVTILAYHNRTLEILNGRIIDPDLDVLSRVQVYGKKYVLNRGVIIAQTDTFDGSWIEMVGTATTPTAIDFSTRTFQNQPVIGDSNLKRPYSPYYDNFDRNLLVLTTTDAEHDGTVTSISVNAPGVNCGVLGDKFFIMHPITGDFDEITLDAAFVNDSTSMSVSSTALSTVYPIDSVIYVSAGSLLDRLYAIENLT